MSKCFLVLGTPRSGTSCVAGILQKLGVFMGEKLMRANPMNEMGFFQDVEFESLSDGLEWMPTEKHEGYPTDALRELVAKRCKMGVDWGVKFRHAPFVLPDFVAACTDEVKLVVLRRSREASIESLTKWFMEGDQDPTEVIDRSLAAIEKAVKDSGLPVIEIDYDVLVELPTDQVAAISTFIEKTSKAEAVDFVTPAMRHYL